MMKDLKKHSADFLKSCYFDSLALGVVDFSLKKFEAFQLDRTEEGIREDGEPVFFDLASVSKPLTNALGAAADPSRLDENMRLLLNHEAGLPAWGLLPAHGWREIIKSYSIQKSETLYSDFSALRFMLEFNERGEKTLHELASKTWDEEVVFWKNLSAEARTVQNGFIVQKPNFRCVHDPNAYVINDYVSHAGLFGTVAGVCKTLLRYDEKHALLDTMNRDLNGPHGRFVNGWDTVADPSNTLAGNGCGTRTFGHLGFTGTSVWIDPVKKLGHVTLCNATKMYWYDKSELNNFRKSIGELIWSESPF